MKLAALAVLLVASTASAGGGAIFIPPAEIDVGAGAPVGAANVGPSTEVLAGIHWASMYWHPTHVDVGVGYVGSFRQVLPGYAFRETTAPDPGANRLALDGAYLSLGYTLESQRYWRTWLDARIETLHASVNHEDFNALGAALRIASEVYVSGATGAGGHGGFAMVAGTFSLGVYVEAVHRDLPAELGPNGVSAGLSMRVPLIIAAGG